MAGGQVALGPHQVVEDALDLLQGQVEAGPGAGEAERAIHVAGAVDLDDPEAGVLIMGLAPGAHGSNRTGRPFTGDASGKFMYPVLYESGFANQATATDRYDGLELKNLYITAAVRCAPPDNKPLPQELAECSQFLDREIAGLEKVKVVVALGKIGFDACLNYMKRRGAIASKQGYLFKHGVSYRLPDGKVLLASYHPSNQNTQTGKLTREMFLEIFKQAAKFADE